MRHHLYRSAAIAIAASAVGFSAQAQEAGEEQIETVATADFCDRQWIGIDGNSDGFISPEEATGALERLFDQIDSDGNGEITKTEYIDCRFQEGQTSAAVERDEESFEEVDVDADDQIAQEEFRDAAEQAFTVSRDAAGPEDEAFLVLRRYVWLTPEQAENVAMLQDMSQDEAAARAFKTFSALDQNDDGIIDAEEWSEEQPVASLSLEELELEFGELDADASNSIDLAEYRSTRLAALDELTTGSTTSAGDESAEMEAVETPAEAGAPVFTYRFWY